MASSAHPAVSRKVNRAETVLTVWAALVFAILWIGFAVALIWNQGKLDDLWQWLRDLPPALELVLWVLFLPIAVGLWVWQSTWAQIVRLAALAGIVAWTVAAVWNVVKLLQQR